MMNLRKKLEKELHNKLRDESLKSCTADYKHLTSNKKFYSITRASEAYYRKWVKERCQNKRVLDYCCGNGEYSLFIAKNGGEIIGIDISEVSIENCKKNALREGMSSGASYFTMDAEKLEFKDSHFDIIICRGVLHHLDIHKAFSELTRVLKPDGEIICIEPLIYNPLIHWYRKATPHLRTKWETEHILSKKELKITEEYFHKIEIKFYHLATLLAVPLRRLRAFNFVLGILEKIDALILSIPLVKWWAWQMILILSKPKK